MPTIQNIKVEIQKPAESSTSTLTNESLSATVKNINPAEVKAAIQAYANDMKANDRMFEFALFNEREVNFEDGKLTFKLENELQKTQLNDYKGVFIDFLRAKFGMSFTLDAEISATTSDTKKLLYTPTDKYKFMVEKYPVLEELKKRLGLELEL